jgi:hypothetical protein
MICTCMSQRATSCCLYKHRSWPIVTCPRPNQSFYPSFSTFSSFHTIDLVSATSTPLVVVLLSYLSSRHHLTGGEAPSSSAGGAPDYRCNRQNQTIQFTKLDSLVSAASSRSFWFLFILCGQHILVTPLGNRSSQTMAHYGMEIYNNNIIVPSIYTNPEVRYTNYLPVGNSFGPSCGNYSSRVEQENFPLSSLVAFSQPTTMQQVMMMNDLYG